MGDIYLQLRRLQVQELSALVNQLQRVWDGLHRAEFCMRINAVETCRTLVPGLEATFNNSLSVAAMLTGKPPTPAELETERAIPFPGILAYIAEIGQCLKQRLVDKLVQAVEPVLTLLFHFADSSTAASPKKQTTKELRYALRGIGRFLQTELFSLSKQLLPTVYDEVVLLFLDWMHGYMQRYAVRVEDDGLEPLSPDRANQLHHCLQYIFGIFERANTIRIAPETAYATPQP